jgi:hypothetical protein
MGSAARYKYMRDWPARYAVVAACYRELRRADPQFPDGACPLAGRLLCEVLPHCTLVCGRYQSAAMERSRLHVWVFDMRAGIHVDLTSGQFPGGQRGIAVIGTDEPMREYTLTPLDEFNELARNPYFSRPMADIVVGKTTLARIRDALRNQRASCRE